jgi:hypothetical protein
MALAGLVAGSVLLMPVLTSAATDANPETAAAPSTGGPKKVSPYAKASRQHLEASLATGAQPLKHPVGQPMNSKPVRAKTKQR